MSVYDPTQQELDLLEKAGVTENMCHVNAAAHKIIGLEVEQLLRKKGVSISDDEVVSLMTIVSACVNQVSISREWIDEAVDAFPTQPKNFRFWVWVLTERLLSEDGRGPL